MVFYGSWSFDQTELSFEDSDMTFKDRYRQKAPFGQQVATPFQCLQKC